MQHYIGVSNYRLLRNWLLFNNFLIVFLQQKREINSLKIVIIEYPKHNYFPLEMTHYL